MLALLNNHPIKLGANLRVEDEIRHPGGRVGDREKSREIAAGLRDRNRTTAFGASLLAVFAQLIDQVPQVLSEVRLAAAGGAGGYLQRDGVEARVVALGVALDQRFELIRVSHRTQPPSPMVLIVVTFSCTP